MKIAILSRWNTACGVSLHSELVGREWVKNGHGLTVFTSENIRPVGEDEEYVLDHSPERIAGEFIRLFDKL